MIAYIIGLIAGAACPTQASVNSRIREEFRSPYITTILNFIFSIIILVTAILIVEKNMYLPLRETAAEPLWIWLGGACGTAIVMLNILCLPKLGSAANAMLMCFGQIMTGLVVDHWALFRSVRVPMSLTRAGGALLVLLGIMLVNGIRRGGTSGHEGGNGLITALYSVLAIVCGFACTAQVAINGALKGVTGSALKATLISSSVGLIAALIVTAIVVMLRGRNGIYDGNEPARGARVRLWMALGGGLAVIIVGGNAVAAPLTGTGICNILNIVGMMAGGLVIDAAGFLGIEKKPVTAAKVAGMLLMTAGAAVITFL